MLGDDRLDDLPIGGIGRELEVAAVGSDAARDVARTHVSARELLLCVGITRREPSGLLERSDRRLKVAREEGLTPRLEGALCRRTFGSTRAL